MSELAPGDRLGKYEIRGELGRGGMGTVYDCWDPVIDRRVAIKTVALPAGNDADAQEGLARFKREAQAAGRLSHPNVVGVFDYGETASLAFIVMEFVDGRTLKEVLGADGRLPLSETLRVMADILAGLDYSHERGVVHRDIKPANIMLSRDGQAKIADFGIARIENSNMTQAGTLLGTPAYMSPEQFMGQVVDRRTDIYSSGVLLYQLLTGERPFEGGLSAIMHKALNTTPPRPSELSVTAPPGLDAVVARAMARRPEDRFDGAAAFARALREGRVAEAPPDSDANEATVIRPGLAAEPARPPGGPAAAVPVRRPSKLPWLAGAGVGLLAAVGAVAWSLLGGEPPTRVVSNDRPANTAGTAGGALGGTPAGETRTVDAAADTSSAKPPEPAVKTETAPDPAGPPPPPWGPAQMRAALAAALPNQPCTLVTGDVSETGAATVDGLTAAGPPEDSLRSAVAAAKPNSTAWRLITFDSQSYCPALDVLRPFASPGDPLRAEIAVRKTSARPMLATDAIIPLAVTVPRFAARMQVDYLQGDGTVAHLVPGAGNPEHVYAAGTDVTFGRPRPDFAGWKVGPPFGTDMIIVVASTAPLFARARPESEPTAAYLRDLQTAMGDLRRRGGSLAANAVVVDTRP